MLPPSLSKVTFIMSVVTVKRSRWTAVGPAGIAGVPGTVVVAGGTPAAPATGGGTAAGVVAGAAGAAGAVAAGFGADGKKVAGRPLWICHWSHSITSEKPKITQRM